MRIAILGAGGWGTALAVMWSRFGRDITLWTPFEKERAELAGGATRLLPGISLPRDLRITGDIPEADIFIIATPSRFVRETARRITSRGIIVSVAKGLEPRANAAPLRMSEVIREVHPTGQIAVLSGPTHAEEVARFLPTTIVAAGDGAELIRDALSTDVFRIYTSMDLIGIELGGTLKNPIAIAAGIGRGLGIGDNAFGALVTRGIAEITRLGVAAGANERTFGGLSGIGDLVTTCVSAHSRNGRVGEEIARGKKLDDILRELGMVAEGVETARTVDAWGKRIGIETPITSAVVRALFENADPKKEMASLMSRTLKDEF